MLEWIIKPLIIGRTTDDMERMESWLKKEAQDINYTSVKPPGLTDKPFEGVSFCLYEY